MTSHVVHLGDCLGPEGLATLPDLTVGTAAEHLVCADLLLGGHKAFLASQVCPYDVAVDAGSRLIRIQVKATRGPRILPQRRGKFPAYMWSVRRAGKGGKRVYAAGEFDMLALVALDTKRIAYLPPSEHRQTIHIRTHDNSGPTWKQGSPGRTFAQFPFSRALTEVMP